MDYNLFEIDNIYLCIIHGVAQVILSANRNENTLTQKTGFRLATPYLSISLDRDARAPLNMLLYINSMRGYNATLTFLFKSS